MSGIFCEIGKRMPAKPFERSLLSVLCACMLTFGAIQGKCGQPRIDHIEKFQGSYVLIHFDTEPNRTYVLQSLNRLACTNGQGHCSKFNVPTNLWVNIYTGFAYPFEMHYVIQDERTTRQRYYRLKVTP